MRLISRPSRYVCNVEFLSSYGFALAREMDKYEQGGGKWSEHGGREQVTSLDKSTFTRILLQRKPKKIRRDEFEVESSVMMTIISSSFFD